MHGTVKFIKKTKQIDHLQQKRNKFMTSDEKCNITDLQGKKKCK